MEGIRDWLQQKAQRIREKGILRKRRSERAIWWTEKDKQRSLLEKGRKLLEELISSSNGRCNPITIFSAQQLQNATNGFESESYYYSTDFDWYKGTLDHGRPILIKRYREDSINYNKKNGGPYRDIVISSLMSSHKNVLKLLGCCLEFPDPILVYEYAKIGPLNGWGGANIINGEHMRLSWKMRLKVAKDVANALTYLHEAFSRPIIHRNIKPQNVVLDESFVAKLCDFSLSITIPEGETVAQDEIVGSFGFVDPTYFGTGCVAEQTDVYGFGVFMLVLITGRHARDLSLLENATDICSYENHMVEQNCASQIIDPRILEEEGGEKQERQMHAFLRLALNCTHSEREDRPLMIQVAKQLRQIEILEQ